MACNITGTIALDCIDSIGGLKAAYIGTDVVIGAITQDVTGVITGLTGATGTLYEYELAKDTASFTETFNISNVNGTAFYSQALSINLQRMSAAKRNQLLLLTKNRDIKVVFLDNNGNYWLMGLSRGAVTTAGTSVTGTAPGDANQYTLTLTADEPAMAYQVASLSALTNLTIANA